jgi:hypothetical protein
MHSCTRAMCTDVHYTYHIFVTHSTSPATHAGTHENHNGIYIAFKALGNDTLVERRHQARRGCLNGNIWTSTDSGATWTEDTSVGATKQWYGVTSSCDGTKL